jgi:hypothetical protein
MINEPAEENLVSFFRADYEIVPGPNYGWNFKCSESRHIIKFSADYDAIIDYAKSYCKTHSSNLVIYNYYHEASERISFKE